MMAKLENLKNKKEKESLYPKFLTDFQNVGTKIFRKSNSMITKKKSCEKNKTNWVKIFRNVKIFFFFFGQIFGQNLEFWTFFEVFFIFS